MGKRDSRIDGYIGKSAEFARPILTHLRELVHRACPEVEETLKWRNPSFMYKGLLAGMAGFKQHCLFGFWKDKLIFSGKAGKSMIPDRITSLADLPADKIIIGYIKEAVRLNEEGVKVTAKPRSNEPRTLEVPDFLTAALNKNKKAQTTFNDFSYSHKKEYVEWLRDAKRPETREQRLVTAVKWLAEGKPRNWKYMNC